MSNVILGDFYDELPKMRTNTVNMILTDLPYNKTRMKWDVELNLKEMWNLFHHVLKDTGVVVLTCNEPFTSKLVMSNLKEFKYDWIWEKNMGGNFQTVRYCPMKEHENILVFGNKITYNPIKQERTSSGLARSKKSYKTPFRGEWKFEKYMKHISTERTILRVPSSIQKFNVERGLHPTQKPVKLFEYLIKTYTNEGDIVLDTCAGSGTTGVACDNLNRNYILIEKEPKYYEVIMKRLRVCV